MEEALLQGIFAIALYKATEKFWDMGLQVAGTAAGTAIKDRLMKWAGKDKESKRKEAFIKSLSIARENTIQDAHNSTEARRVLEWLDSGLDGSIGERFAEEAAKLMLFSATPDILSLTRICQKAIASGNLEVGEESIECDEIASILSLYLENVRDALLDQEPYYQLVEREMLRCLQDIVAELLPVEYDDEATYRYQTAEMYRQMDFIGIPGLRERRAVSLDNIFVNLRAEKDVGAAFAAAEGLSTSFSDAEKMPGAEMDKVIVQDRTRNIVDLIQEFKNADRLVILGDPGSGKTTLLKYVALMCALNRTTDELEIKVGQSGSPLPVYMALREYAAEAAMHGQSYSLIDYIYAHTRRHLMLRLPPGFFEEALEAGRCMILLDGLDEVWSADQRRIVCDAVKALGTRFPKNRCVVTSRVVGYEEAPLAKEVYRHYTVLPLSDESIIAFVNKWYKWRKIDHLGMEKQAEALIKAILAESGIHELARNPLLLTIIALIHHTEAELPHERVKLYDKCVTALLETWDAVKGLTIEEKQRPFYRRRHRLLERLAFELHSRAREPNILPVVKRGDLEILIANFLIESECLSIEGDFDIARQEAEAFIRLAQRRTGLLVEKGTGLFCFPHYTFQEYLAACDIEKRCIYKGGVEAIWNEIEMLIFETHWQEAILLLLGSLNKYDEAPTLLAQRIVGAGEADKFERVLHRSLFLVGKALADRVEIQKDLHRTIVEQLANIARTGMHDENVLYGDASEALAILENLKGDSYALAALLDMVQDNNLTGEFRGEVVEAIGIVGRGIDSVVEFLIEIAKDEEEQESMRFNAISVLGEVGIGNARAFEGLIDVASTATYSVDPRVWAAISLNELGGSKEAGPILIGIAKDQKLNPMERGSAIAYIEEVLPNKEAAYEIREIAQNRSEDKHVRRIAALWLGRLGEREAAAKVLAEVAMDEELGTDERVFAASSLLTLGYKTEAIAVVEKLQQNMDAFSNIEGYSLSWLARIYPEAKQIIRNILQRSDLNDKVRLNAVFAMKGEDLATIADILIKIMNDEEEAIVVRQGAATSLGMSLSANEHVINALLELAVNEGSNSNVRAVAVKTLVGVEHARQSVDRIVKLAKDENTNDIIRVGAAAAAGSFGRASEMADILLAITINKDTDLPVRVDAYELLKTTLSRVKE